MKVAYLQHAGKVFLSSAQRELIETLCSTKVATSLIVRGSDRWLEETAVLCLSDPIDSTLDLPILRLGVVRLCRYQDTCLRDVDTGP